MQATSIIVLCFISVIGAEESREQCPRADFLAGIPVPGKHCDFSHHCSKVTCVAQAEGHKMTLGVNLKKCDGMVTATVSLKELSSDTDWSHTFKDGEKAKLPVTPSMFTGGFPVSDASFFIQVGLKKMNGSNFNYTVKLMGQVSALGETNPVNVMLLQGESPTVSTEDCSSWFSKQPVSVKVLVIILPVTVLVFLGLGIALYYKRHQQGLGLGRVPMQRLTNEV